MQFTPTYLKVAENNNVHLGNWNGCSVYAIHKQRILDDEFDSDNAYVIYDDSNLLFYKWKTYGTVKPDGSVVETSPRRYMVKKDVPPVTTTTSKPPVEEYKSEVIGDVNLEIEVEKMLQNGRGTTVEELLKGFNYGLN